MGPRADTETEAPTARHCPYWTRLPNGKRSSDRGGPSPHASAMSVLQTENGSDKVVLSVQPENKAGLARDPLRIAPSWYGSGAQRSLPANAV